MTKRYKKINKSPTISKLIKMGVSDNADLIGEEENGISFKKKKKLIISLFIMIALDRLISGFIMYYMLQRDLIFIFQYEFITSVYFILVFYILAKPIKIKISNKGIYVILGITPFGSGLWFSYILFCNYTNFDNLLINLGSIGNMMHITIQICLFLSGLLISYLIGKKNDFRIPITQSY